MPETSVRFYREGDGQVPVLDWLTDLRDRDEKAYANCVAAIQRKRRYEQDPDRHEANERA